MSGDDLSGLILDNKKQLKTVKNNQKSKGGRPKKSESESLIKHVTVNFTEDEYNSLVKKAGSIPVAVFIKVALKNGGVI